MQKEVASHMQLVADYLSNRQVELVHDFPKLPDVREAFLTLRGEFFVAEFGELYARHRTSLKDTVVWNIEQGMKLSASEIVRAQKIRAAARARRRRTRPGPR